MTLDQLTEQVWKRLQNEGPRVLLIGEKPPVNYGFFYVRDGHYDAIMLGVLSIEELLKMPTDPVCNVLIRGNPVYYWSGQLFRKQKIPRMLFRLLQEAEERLQQCGIQRLPDVSGWLTAQDVRTMRQMNVQIQSEWKMTPLARQIMEEMQ